MTAIQEIKHGAPAWDSAVNANFQALASSLGTVTDFKTTKNVVGLNGASPNPSDADVKLWEFGKIAILRWYVRVKNLTNWASWEVKPVMTIDNEFVGQWTDAEDFRIYEPREINTIYDMWLDSKDRPGEIVLRFMGDDSGAKYGADGININGAAILTRP